MLHIQIKDQLKDAMKARDELKMSVIRSILTGFTNELVKKRSAPPASALGSGEARQDFLEDDEALAVIKRLANQRKDSIEQFTKGDREDLAQKEREELAILATYLPAQMSQEEIEKIAKAKIEELGTTDKSKSGQLIGAVMREVQGQADGQDVKNVVESLLS